MPAAINKRCPNCGRRPHDRLLVQCPDCRVAFVQEEPAYDGLTPEQLRLVARQIFKSWKFWAVLVGLVGAAAWGVVTVADRIIDLRSREYLSTLGQQATNQIGRAFGQISNQISLEFKQPKIKATVEQVARERASDIFTNAVRPSLEAFQDALDLANAQLAHSSNVVAELEKAALAAQRKIPPPAPLAPVVQVMPVPKILPAVAADSTAKLVLANRTVTQSGTGYILTLFFRATNNPPGGAVDLVAGTYKQTAQILNFASMTSAPTAPSTLNATGDVARLRFTVSDRESPTLVLELTAPTIVRLVSESLDTDLTIPVAADKMQLPSVNK